MSTIAQLAAAEDRERAEAPAQYAEILRRDVAGKATPADSEDLQRVMSLLGLKFADVKVDLAALAEVRRLENEPPADDGTAALAEALDSKEVELARHRKAMQVIDGNIRTATLRQQGASSAAQNRSNRLSALRASHPRVFAPAAKPAPEPDRPVMTGSAPTPRQSTFGEDLAKCGGYSGIPRSAQTGGIA